MTTDSAEYKALERVVKADKRYRRFLYALGIAMFILLISGLFALYTSISNKIDTLVDGSVARGAARQQENKTIARETERYNTCIFVLLIPQRTVENQQKCFDAADLPGGLDRGDFTPINIPIFVEPGDASTGTSSAPAPAVSSSSSASTPSSSSNPTPPTPTPQPNTSQPASPLPNCRIDLAFIHLVC